VSAAGCLLALACAAPAEVPTALGRDAVAPADLIVVARVDRVWSAGQRTAVARMVVGEVLDGTRRGEVTVLCYPGEFRTGERELLFLAATRSGARHIVLRRLSGRDPAFGEKVAVTRRTIELSSLAPEAVERETLHTLVGWVESGPHWTRLYALDELWALAERRPRAFDAELVDALAALAARPVASWRPPRAGAASGDATAAGPSPPAAPTAGGRGRDTTRAPDAGGDAAPGGFAWEPLDGRGEPAPGDEAEAPAADGGDEGPAGAPSDEARSEVDAAARDVAVPLRRLVGALQSRGGSLPTSPRPEQSPR